MTSVIRPKIKTAQDIKVRPKSAVARRALSVDAADEVVDLVAASGDDHPLKASQLGILQSPSSKNRPKSAIAKSEKVLQDMFPYLAHHSPKPLIEDHYPGITSDVTPGKIRPSSSPCKKELKDVDRIKAISATITTPPLSRKPPIEKQKRISTQSSQHPDEKRKPIKHQQRKTSSDGRDMTDNKSDNRDKVATIRSDRDRNEKSKDLERERRRRERRKREKRKQDLIDRLRHTDEYGLALNPKEKKLLPSYHHLAKLQDDEAENERQMREFDKKKVRGHNALRDPNAPEKTIFPTRDEKKRFNKSFKYGDDEVTLTYPPDTARTEKTEISNVSAFRVMHHHPHYSAQQPMKMPADDGVTWKLSKASWDDATISSHGSSSNLVVEPEKVISGLSKCNKKSEYQEKYDSMKTLATYKDFKEACDDLPNNLVIQRERQILTSFFFATEGHNWHKDITRKMTCMDLPWCGDYPHKQWHGVTTASPGAANNQEGIVIELNLRKRNLRGVIPLCLGKMTHLEMLDLSHNRLFGEIPIETFDRMKSLMVLSLENNNLTGHIHHSLFIALPNLVELWLSGNQLSGPIPSITIEMNLNLTHLCLANNQLSGEIPPAIAYLTSLQCLTLSNNRLSGEVPSGMLRLTKLTQLSMHNNLFTGQYPLFLEKLPRMRELHLFHNQFEVRPVNIQQPVYHDDGDRREWYTLSEQKIPINVDLSTKKLEIKQLMEMGVSTGLVYNELNKIKSDLSNKNPSDAPESTPSVRRRALSAAQQITQQQEEELELAQIEHATLMSE